MTAASSLDPRTYLFVPGDRPERFDKALASGADAVVLDLEDAVAPEHKGVAREAVAARLRAAGPDASRLVVRINDEASAEFAADVAMLQATGAHAVMLPKAEWVPTIERLRAACPGTAVLALVETARGVLAAEALAAAAGVVRLVFGTIDFALDLGLSGDPIGLDLAAGRLALASRAAGIAAPVAGVTTAIDDDTLLRTELARARAHGFNAKLCIHPRQVAAVHAALRPADDEIAWAHRVVAAMQGAAGAVRLDGRMIDRPVLLRAERIIASAARR
jgi:citrate lyase subunit beta / citryl-CoA lyase